MHLLSCHCSLMILKYHHNSSAGHCPAFNIMFISIVALLSLTHTLNIPTGTHLPTDMSGTVNLTALRTFYSHPPKAGSFCRKDCIISTMLRSGKKKKKKKSLYVFRLNLQESITLILMYDLPLAVLYICNITLNPIEYHQFVIYFKYDNKNVYFRKLLQCLFVSHLDCTINSMILCFNSYVCFSSFLLQAEFSPINHLQKSLDSIYVLMEIIYHKMFCCWCRKCQFLHQPLTSADSLIFFTMQPPRLESDTLPTPQQMAL